MSICKIFTLTILLVLQNIHGMPQSECKTIDGDGPQRNKPCMFPFYFEGRLVYSCITSPDRPRPWCSISDIYQSDKWGYCSDACPIVYSMYIFTLYIYLV